MKEQYEKRKYKSSLNPKKDFEKLNKMMKKFALHGLIEETTNEQAEEHKKGKCFRRNNEPFK
jgi:hypothetical protein